ncbi:LOW QUALITY PROTEIN: ubiquitin-like protein ISG15 [Phyllopteryx taeniolatus]|uniref:LOW QUALITY PROTEIN: ubiquitin-like protein ISG15 n=1 Tax=Phyllopteryx taeniolatus TaxID=161469 RepID=UPI002AD3AF2B|nr:LOW QUALITY PROTEIN: ubiquitin-like protein ISG15 [Phyllopteryx taeniolatus]
MLFEDVCMKLAGQLMMEITITMLTGRSQTLTVCPEDTVKALKNLIETKTGIAAHTRKLVLAGSRRTPPDDDDSCGPRVCLLAEESRTVQVFLRNEKGQPSTYEIDTGEQRGGLVHQGREMASGKLEDYDVGASSTIDTTFRLRGS